MTHALKICNQLMGATKEHSPPFYFNFEIYVWFELVVLNYSSLYTETKAMFCEWIIYKQSLLVLMARGDHWAKIVEQRAIKNRVQYIHCR